jgi:hypothetical protein
MKWAATFVCTAAILVHAQEFSQRGFVAVSGTFYPETFPIDSTRAIGGILAQYEPKWQPKPWLTVNASFNLGADSHQQFARNLHFDWEDRSLQRAAFSIRQLAAAFTKANFTITLGKQFIRWGEADFLNPTDRFAPTDLLNLAEQEVLPVTAARAAYTRGDNTFNVVWQPEFTPARIPLINQRWTFLPPAYYSFAIEDQGALFPGRSSFGARWSHSGATYEYSLSFYDGFNYFPDFNVHVDTATSHLTYTRVYPALRLYGGDLTAPLSLCTFKAEGGYYTSSTKNQDEYVLYLLELERQIHETHITFGYAGEVVTAHGDALQYLGERGFARGLISHVLYTLDSNRALTLDAFLRQNGASSVVSPAYSQSFRDHWRATVGFTWLRGEANDFLGQYHRNSFVNTELRYSF